MPNPLHPRNNKINYTLLLKDKACIEHRYIQVVRTLQTMEPVTEETPEPQKVARLVRRGQTPVHMIIITPVLVTMTSVGILIIVGGFGAIPLILRLGGIIVQSLFVK